MPVPDLPGPAEDGKSEGVSGGGDFFRLWMAVAMAVVCTTLAGLTAPLFNQGMGRVGEVALIRPLLRIARLARFDAVALAPEFWLAPHPLVSADGASILLSGVLLSYGVLFCLLGLGLTMAQTLLGGPRTLPGRRVWPAARALSLILPVFLAAEDLVPTSIPSLLVLAAATLLALALWLVVSVVPFKLRHHSRLRMGVHISILAILALGLVAGPGLAGLPRPRPHPDAPHVLLISVDSLRADHLGAYGYERETSPVMDRLAAEGALLTSAFAPSPWTLPSHITMLTGLPPELHGIVLESRRLSRNAVTLAQVFREAGYDTGGFVSGPFLNAIHGYARGFQTYDDHTVPAASHQASHLGSTSPALGSLVTDWLVDRGTAPDSRPFFIFLHMWDVHYDYAPPPPFNRMFDPDYSGDLTAAQFRQGIDAKVLEPMDARDLAHAIALYDGEIRFTDGWIGRILDTLEERRVLENTLVILTADHGEEFFEHGLKGHGKTLYGEVVRVPLILRWPGRIPPGLVGDAPVRLMDLAPTIVELAGIRSPARFGLPEALSEHGPASFRHMLVGGATPDQKDRPVFMDLHRQLAAISTSQYKLIQHVDGSSPPELYDLVADPGEHVNIWDAHTGPGRRLEGALSRWRTTWQIDRGLAEHLVLDEDQKDNLRTLGYVD